LPPRAVERWTDQTVRTRFEPAAAGLPSSSLSASTKFVACDMSYRPGGLRFDPSRFVVGDEWAYRLRDDSASERVRILTVTPKKASARIDVVFVDDPDGRVDNVAGTRLRVPWREVAAFDALMANWQRIGDLELDSTEEACVEDVFRLLIPEEVAELEQSPVSCATFVRDSVRLSEIIRVPAEEILAAVEWFEHHGGTMLSPAGTLLVAEAACRANPKPVLDLVMQEETEARHKCKHGSERVSGRTGEKKTTLPEDEYEWYRRWDRPHHELLRQWCGHRAVTFHERLCVAEAENHRLDVLVTELIAALEGVGKTMLAETFAVRHERDRITPERVRPVVDRPLQPWEMPVREVYVRRRWQ
jgi:hypothetical protein